jgi:hypothetical protein
MGIGDWGLGIGPIPNPHLPVYKFYFKFYLKYITRKNKLIL